MILHPVRLSHGFSSEVQDAIVQMHHTGSNSSDGDLPLHTVSNIPADCSPKYFSLRSLSIFWEQFATS